MDTKNTSRYAWQPYIVAIAVIAAATAPRVWPLHILGVRLAWLTFFPAVTVAALYGGFSAGLLGTFLSCLAVLFVLPLFVHQPFIRDSHDWLGLAVFFATCTMISGIAEATRRSQAREKQSEAELGRFFTLSLDLLCVAGFDGYFKRLNPMWEATLGFTAEELLAKPFLDFVHPEDLEATTAVAQNLAAGEKTVAFRNRYLCKDGSYRWLSWNAIGFPEQQQIYATARDITEIKKEEEAKRKRVEDALHGSEEIHRLIVESVRDYAIFMLDTQGRVASWNQGAENIKGYKAEEILGRDFSCFYTAEDRERGKPQEELKEAVARGSVQDEGWRVRKDGSRFWAFVVITVLRDLDGQLRGFSKVTRDITERKQMEDSLRESEARLDFALSTIHTGAWSLDLLDHTAHRTLTHDRIFGYETLLPMWTYEMFLEHVLPEDRPAVERSFGEAIAAQSDWSFECRIRRTDSEVRWIWAAGVHERNLAGTPVQMSGIVQDITERKRAEEEVRKLNENLERRVTERTAELQSANVELEAFTYSVSHDLRAPLRQIDGFSRILLDEAGPQLDATAQRYLQRVREGAGMMGRLVDDLLGMARVGRQELRLQITGLKSLVDEVMADLGPEIKDRRVEWRIGDLPFVECDPALIKVAMVNLISNAVKYTRPRELAVIEVGSTEQDGQPVVFVRDNGVGFNMKYADKLFGVFQRLHRSQDFEGTGVGLATAQRVIHKHGGRIWAEAELDKGASFYFTLGATQKAGVRSMNHVSGTSRDSAG